MDAFTFRHRRATAFTLVEVLIVVGIIALLAGILLPSLRQARERSRQIICRNNLRSIWSGILTYSLQNRDRVPFMEDVNLSFPEADPFDARYSTTAGRVLFRYVLAGSWVCPSAVAGYPKNEDRRGWKMTYTFSAAGKVGEGVPYDRNAAANTGGPLDPVISNYVHFDGRPLRRIDGRRYLQSFGLNRRKGYYWNVRLPIIAETLSGQPTAGKPIYPHFGAPAVRVDLANARSQFEANTQGNGAKPIYHELHADGDRSDIFLTRYWQQHWPGY